MTHPHRWIALVAALQMFPVAPSNADAQAGSNTGGVQAAAREHEDVARAEAYAADAYEAYQAQHYTRAAALYEQALEAAQSADIVYNLARIYDAKLRDRKQAIEYYERYVYDTGADPTRARTAHERLRALRELERMVQEHPAVEDPPPQPVEPATVEAASVPEVEVQLRADTRDGRRWRAKLSGLQVAGLVIGSVGLVGLGVGTGFGVVAKRDADEANRVCDGNVCREQAGVDAAETASDAALVSTIGFVTGGALLLTGIGMLVWGGDAQDAEHAGARVVPLTGGGLFGAAAMGRW